MYKNCKECGKVFSKRDYNSLAYWRRRLFCSISCSKIGNTNHTGYKHSHETKEKLRIAHLGKPAPWNKYERTVEQRIKLGNARRGMKIPHSEETKRKISLARTGKPVPSRQGEKSSNWKGGITSINKLIRSSLQYKLWRKHVFQRDNFTCQSCGKRGGELHADHELPFADYPDLRLEILNGRTLCVLCHRATPTYGGNYRKLFNFTY